MNFRQEFELSDIKNLLVNFSVEAKPIERRLYYDSEGRVITYTCENLPGDFIVVTPEQFAEARPDVLVRNGKLIYTHKLSHVTKLAPSTSGTATSKWDVNILVDPAQESHEFWELVDNEIESTDD
jgi:hypothetical protein